MATDIFIENANQKAVVSSSDKNPIIPPDISPAGTYNFNLYYLDLGSPDTYHRFQTASMELNLRMDGPPSAGTFTLTFLGYTTNALLVNITNADLLTAFSGLRSVGAGNVKVSGNLFDGWSFEFIGNRAGLAESPIQVDVSALSPASNATVGNTQIGGINGSNSIQLVRFKQNRVATINNFTELTAGNLWGWATATALDTSGLPAGFWTLPSYDIVLEVKLFPNGGRSGSDGVTTNGTQTRSGTDGVTSTDSGRSGTGKVGYQSGQPTHNVIFGKDYAPTYNGTLFTQDDVGRTISGTGIPGGTTILSVVDGAQNYALLSAGQSSALGYVVSWTTGGKISNVLTSASANFVGADLGLPVTGANFQAGTVISTITSSTVVTLSQTPIAAGTGLSWTITDGISRTYQSASAMFVSGDVGKLFTGTYIPANTTILSRTDATHVVLSNAPTAIGTGLAWTITSATITGPSVTRTQTGDSTHQEIQRISFNNRPAFGSFTLQDGAGGQPITGALSGIFNTGAIKDALNTLYPGKAPFDVNIITPSVFEVTFGVAAAQSLLIVNDANIVYDFAVLRFVLSYGNVSSGAGGTDPSSPRIIYDGDFTVASPCSQVLSSQPFANDPDTLIYRQQFCQFRSKWRQLPKNTLAQQSGITIFTSRPAYLISESQLEDVGAGVVMWWREWSNIPNGRTEYKAVTHTYENVIQAGYWVVTGYTPPGWQGTPFASGSVYTIGHAIWGFLSKFKLRTYSAARMATCSFSYSLSPMGISETFQITDLTDISYNIRGSKGLHDSQLRLWKGAIYELETQSVPTK